MSHRLDKFKNQHSEILNLSNAPTRLLAAFKFDFLLMNLNRVGGMSAYEPSQKRTDFMEMTFRSHKNDFSEQLRSP